MLSVCDRIVSELEYLVIYNYDFSVVALSGDVHFWTFFVSDATKLYWYRGAKATSVAHPNEDLLEEPEAMLVINAICTLLHNLVSKLYGEVTPDDLRDQAPSRDIESHVIGVRERFSWAGTADAQPTAQGYGHRILSETYCVRFRGS